jgi:excisionase family DNA binding protein
MPSTPPLEIVEPTASAVRAARRSRGSLADAAEKLGARKSGTVRLEELELPVSVLHALSRMMQELSEGHAVLVHSLRKDSAEVTTTQAARLLGMSRPTLVTLLDHGLIHFRMVGTHRRLRVSDVLAFGKRAALPREEKLQGLREMAESSDRLGLGY